MGGFVSFIASTCFNTDPKLKIAVCIPTSQTNHKHMYLTYTKTTQMFHRLEGCTLLDMEQQQGVEVVCSEVCEWNM